MIARPCLGCGEPTDATRCPACIVPAAHTESPTARGYDYRWTVLSARARRAQPFCTDCGARDDLTTDHTTEAWQRRAAGLPIRLSDVDVLCRPCNGARGPARPATRGDAPSGPVSVPAAKARSRSHTPGGAR